MLSPLLAAVSYNVEETSKLSVDAADAPGKPEVVKSGPDAESKDKESHTPQVVWACLTTYTVLGKAWLCAFCEFSTSRLLDVLKVTNPAWYYSMTTVYIECVVFFFSSPFFSHFFCFCFFHFILCVLINYVTL